MKEINESEKIVTDEKLDSVSGGSNPGTLVYDPEKTAATLGNLPQRGKTGARVRNLIHNGQDEKEDRGGLRSI